MSKLYFIHALDATTIFLGVFQENFQENFFTVEPNEDSVDNSIKYLREIPANSTVVFLGHGHSTGLYTPEAVDFEKQTFIDASTANELFANKKVILLSCRSNELSRKIDSAKHIIGFGNIISSPEELRTEADLETAHYRDLSKDDIDYFNSSYCSALVNALQSYQKGALPFRSLPHLIEFYINKKINEVLLNKSKANRIEISKILFEFRNEMYLKSSPR